MNAAATPATATAVAIAVGFETREAFLARVLELALGYYFCGIEPTSAARSAANDCGVEFGTEAMRETVTAVLQCMGCE